jgi:hypothetical protein
VKRFFATILLSLYVFSVTPSLAQIHICGENFKAIQFIGEGESMDCCGEKKCCDCCHDIVVSVDTDEHATAKHTIGVDVDFSFTLPTFFTTNTLPNFSIENDFEEVLLHPPPLIAKEKMFIQYCTLVFYA